MHQLKPKLKAIGYIRVSTSGQGDNGFSLSQQVEEIERHCGAKGLELVAQFTEVESAATIKDRPILKEAIWQVCHRNIADVIVVTNLDRATRCLLDFELFWLQLERTGKQLVSIQQSYLTPLGLNEDDESLEFLRSARQQEVLRAESERRLIRRRSIRGRRQKAQIGGWIGHRPPYGYDARRGKLYEDPEQQYVLRLIRRLDKWFAPSNYWIAHYLNGDNDLLNPDGTRGRVFPPPSARPPTRERRVPLKKQLTGKWSQGTIWRILNCPERYVAEPPRLAGNIIRTA